MQLKVFNEKAKEYANEFVQDESGMELLQFAIVVVITCGLIVAVTGVQSAISKGLERSATRTTQKFDEILGPDGP